ncbi:MAG TPA: tetratricopeptide repeat protein, partial [Patescibacteria group bacterium]|nr:tetratricopeptide repeat protein [Patescibacteria group bacterium]
GGIFDDAHNLFLQFAVTGGAQFALAFLGLLGFALWQYSGTARRGDDIALAAASGIIGFAVMACFNPVPAPCLLACMLLVAGSGLQSDREFKFTLPRPAAWAAAGAGALLILAGLDLAVSEHIFFAGRNAYLAGDYPSAARLSRLASTLNPTNQLSYVYYAGSLININPLDPQVPDAIRRAIAAHPTTGVSYSLAATLDFRAALRSGVLEYYNQSVANMMLAINHDPYFPLRYTRLGYIYLRGGRFDEAREALKQSLALDDSSVPSWVMLAKVYQLQGKRQQVIAALTEGFKRQPGIEDLSQLLKKAKQEPNVSRMPIPLQGEGGPIE